MRIRIRGPNGQSTVNLDDEDDVQTLRQRIEAETSLIQFDVKYGYPPKVLDLAQYEDSRKLNGLDIRLNGEQLIVSHSSPSANDVSSKDAPASRSPNAHVLKEATPSRQPDPKALAVRPTTAKPTIDQKTAAPLSLTRKDPFEMSDPPEVKVPELGATLLLRVMPDDNSCLFRAIATAVMSGLDTMTELRSMVAQTIRADSDKYTEVVLDNKSPDEYCRWIQTEEAWGGQIELDILSQQFDIEICSIDVQTLRVDRYNESAPNRCILVYSGIHYDTIALTLVGLTPNEDVKIFEPGIKDIVLPQAVQLCGKLQAQHYYTDTAGFTIKCNDCGTICTGEQGAQDHAKNTGHYNFGESR